jgi:hypothetical protein
MRSLKLNKTPSEAELTAKLRDEAVAWRKRRPPQAKFSTAGVQVVRLPKRRRANTGSNARSGRS